MMSRMDRINKRLAHSKKARQWDGPGQINYQRQNKPVRFRCAAYGQDIGLKTFNSLDHISLLLLESRDNRTVNLYEKERVGSMGGTYQKWLEILKGCFIDAVWVSSYDYGALDLAYNRNTKYLRYEIPSIMMLVSEIDKQLVIHAMIDRKRRFFLLHRRFTYDVVLIESEDPSLPNDHNGVNHIPSYDISYIRRCL